MTDAIRVDRLWAPVVAERLSFERDEALTPDHALAGLAAHHEGVRLGIFEPSAPKDVRDRRGARAEGERLEVHLIGRTIPTVRTPKGLRALAKDQPTRSKCVKRYLEGKFRDALGEARAAMERLATAGRAGSAGVPALRRLPAGGAGWGRSGVLDLT